MGIRKVLYNLNIIIGHCVTHCYSTGRGNEQEVVLPKATPSALLLKDSRGSTGPGGGDTTEEQEGATLHTTVGGYTHPEEGGGHDWINYNTHIFALEVP